jgi:hypothetical protein
VSRTPYPEKIRAFRRLPTEDRPGIVLYGDQSIDLANPWKECVAGGPILHYAIGMFHLLSHWLCRCLPRWQICVHKLAAAATAKKAKHAKATQRQMGCGKSFSHDGSPIDSVQYSANGHITCRILSSAAPMFTLTLGHASSNVITICIIL